MPSFGTFNSLAQQHGRNTTQILPMVLRQRTCLRTETSTYRLVHAGTPHLSPPGTRTPYSCRV